MKYRPVQYAEALYDTCEGTSEAEQKKIIKKFVEVLAHHQAVHKAREVYAAYEKLSLRKQGLRSVRLETASPGTEKLKQEVKAILGTNIHIEEVTNSSMLGGVTILIDNEILIDASVKRHMEDIFIKKSPSMG